MATNKNGYEITALRQLVHRLVSCEHDGKIPKGWHVHHCDGNKLNNNIDNLVQIPEVLHVAIHTNSLTIFNKLRPSKNEILKIRESWTGRSPYVKKTHSIRTRKRKKFKKSRVYTSGLDRKMRFSKNPNAPYDYGVFNPSKVSSEQTKTILRKRDQVQLLDA